MLETSGVFSRHFFAILHFSHEVPQGKHQLQLLHFKSKRAAREKKGKPLALTLGTTILLTLCNFVIAEDQAIIN